MEDALKQLTLNKAIITGIFLAGFYYAAMYDSGERLEQSIQNSNSQIAAKKAELATLERSLVDSEVHRETSKKLGSEMETILKAVPEDYKSPQLMRTLSEQAKASGTSIEALAPAVNQGAQDQGSEFKPVVVSVSLSGTFNQVMLFMSNLTKVGKIILVNKLELVPTSPDSVFEENSPKLRYEAEFQAYRYEPAEEPNAQ